MLTKWVSRAATDLKLEPLRSPGLPGLENHHENVHEKEKYLRTTEELDEHHTRRIEASQILPNNRKRLQRL